MKTVAKIGDPMRDPDTVFEGNPDEDGPFS